MWKYLIFNSFWFLALFLVHFAEGRHLRIAAFLSIVLLALFTAFKTTLDPYVWFFYLVFSLLVYWGASRFKRWALSGIVALDEEQDILSRALEKKRSLLLRETEETGVMNQKASEISHLYDKIKEMSQSLDMLETFLIFGEALAAHCQFDTIKLALFHDESDAFPHLEVLYGLRHSDLEGMFDRSIFMKDRKKVTAEVFPFDRHIFEEVFRSKVLLDGVDPKNSHAAVRFTATPVLVDKKVTAVLTLVNVHENDSVHLSVLVDLFIAEAQRIKLYEKVETLAITDGLTGVYVRRHLVERLEEEIGRSKRFGFHLSFLMVDIDHFKNFNDQYGHLVGDVVLRQVAETIKKNVREVDLVGRYGGEEFGVILVETEESGAFYVAERIRRAISERDFKAYDENLKVTVSIGCAAYSEKMNQNPLIIEAADSALYQAKRQGRNKVCLSSLPVSP